MEVETGETDIIVPCIRNCGKEINLKNMEDHLSNCPLEIVECGWCGLRQSQNVFKEHIKLVNPEKEINNAQQCMQRQCSQLSKQQNKFNTFLQEQQKQLDDMKNQLIQLNKQNSKFNSKFQQYITRKSFMICIALMLIINFSHIFYHLYWLQSPQVTHSQTDTLNTLKMLLDNHNDDIKFLQEDLKEIKSKYKLSEKYKSFTNILNDYQRDIDIDCTKLDFGLECMNIITGLNQSIGNQTKKLQEWMIKMEENCTKTFDLASELNDQLNAVVRLNQSIINATKQWHVQLVELEKNFTTMAEITDLIINDQLNLIIQTMLNKTKHWENRLMEIENNFTTVGEISYLRSEVTDLIIKLNQTMLNETKQWQKSLTEIEDNFTTMAEISDLRTEVNDLIIKLNKSMINETKQWQKHLTKMEEETFTVMGEINDLRSEVTDLIIKLNKSMNNETRQLERYLRENLTTMAEIIDQRSEVTDLIIKLNQTVLNETKQWQKHVTKMEETFTAMGEITDLRSEITDLIIKLNKSMINESRQLERYLKENLTMLAEITNLRSELTDLIIKLNQTMLNETKQQQKHLMEVEENFTTMAEITDLRSEVNDLIIKLNKSMINETRKWERYLNETKKNFTAIGEMNALRLEVNDLIIKLNQTMFNETKQWQKHLIKVEENFTTMAEITDLKSELTVIIKSTINETKKWERYLKENLTTTAENLTKIIANLSFEMYEQLSIKMNQSSNTDGKIKSPQLGNGTCEEKKEKTYQNKYKNLLELKLLEQSNNIMLENSKTLPVIFALPNFSEKMKNTEEWYSSLFFAFNGGYLMMLEVCVSGYGNGKGTHVSVFLRLMRGPYDNELQQSGHWPLRGSFTVELLNQFNDNDHYNCEVIFSTYTCNECTKRIIDANLNANRWGCSQFISHNVIQQRKDDKHLYFNVSYNDVNPLIPCNQTTPVTMKMSNLSEKINNKEQWYSSPFFAFDGGYQMCLTVHATSYDIGKATLSVFIHLMKGPHDEKLQQSGHWPLRGTFTIKLLNQFSDHHHSVNVTFSTYSCEECTKRVVKGDMAVSWGLPVFLSHDHDITSSNLLNFEIFYEDNNPPIPCHKTAPVTLRMHKLNEKINNKEQWYSSPFFAFDGGYQMCLKVYAAGHDTDEDTYFFIYIHLMKGPHDDKLQQTGHWPLRGTFTIKLLNQFSDHHHSINVTFSTYSCEECTKRVVKGDMAVSWGLPSFLSFYDTADYLMNNFPNFEIFYEDINPPIPCNQTAPVTIKMFNLSEKINNKEQWYSIVLSLHLMEDIRCA